MFVLPRCILLMLASDVAAAVGIVGWGDSERHVGGWQHVYMFKVSAQSASWETVKPASAVASIVAYLCTGLNVYLWIFWVYVMCCSAHWAETDHGFSAGQHAVLPEGKGKVMCCLLRSFTVKLYPVWLLLWKTWNCQRVWQLSRNVSHFVKIREVYGKNFVSDNGFFYR